MPYVDPEAARQWDRRRDRSRRHAADRERRCRERERRQPPGTLRCGHPAAEQRRQPRGRLVCLACKRSQSQRERDRRNESQRLRSNLMARARNQDRKARKRRMFVEHVDPLILFERDEGICGICNDPVDPQRFDVDHIVPLDPGEHSYANTQIAHPRCNQSKQRRVYAGPWSASALAASHPS